LFALATPTSGASQEPREVLAGIPRSWPPQYSLDDNGNPTGFAIDIMEEIAARAGLRVGYRVMDSFAEVSEAMNAGHIDIIPNSGITPDRAAKFAFTAPVETFVVSIFAREGAPKIRGAEDLQGLKVGVVEFNIGQRLMRDRDDLELVVYRDAETALFSLVAGHIDAMVFPQPVLLNLARKVGIADRIEVVGPPLREVKRGIRVQMGETELLAALNQAVNEFVGTPAYQAIYLKWYGAAQPFWTVSRVIVAMGALAVFVLIAMAWWRYHSLVNLNRGLRDSISERERTEMALRESRDHLRLITDYLPAVICYLDNEHRYRFVNRTLTEWYDRPADEILGRTVGEIVGPEVHDQIRPYLEAAASGKEQHFELNRNFPNGVARVLAIVYVPHFNDKGEVQGFFALVQDVTEKIRAEGQLRQAQKMEAVGQLTAGVAHDFNNMLAVIWGNAELLEDELGEGNPPLAAVFRATKRAADLTQRLLAFSRKQVLNPEIINVNGLIADTTGLLQRTLEEHIDIETVTAAGLWNCEVDPAQLENALVNLAINARDAMPDGGKLTIETANARLDDDYAAAQADVTPGQYVMLAVTDTGTGMPPEVREHVFEPFFTTKEVGHGSGLGLSMVYGFVKQSGGHVTVYSEEGEGTTIKIYLPRSAGAGDVERKPAMDEVPVAQGETVLVVEDDPDVRTLAVALLSKLGYQIMEAATGAAALAELGTTTRVNLLLTDVVLPGGMNGRELATEIARRVPGIQVLYMSGYTEDAIMHHGRLDADAKLLQKPFRRADLARAVRSVLDGPST